MSQITYISQSEYDREYRRFLLSEKEKICPEVFNLFTKPIPQPSHDYWSLYAYGDILKIVYIKRGKRVDSADRKNYTAAPDIKSEDERFKQSVSRSKARVFELAACNEFNFFCTFTQDEKKRDRFNLSEFRKDFAQLVRNLNRGRENKIKYLLIPEQHKDGAWHMHGLFKGLSVEKDLRAFTLSEKLPQRIRAALKSGECVYDWTAYRRRFGFFTCTEIKSGIGCAKYITKYISKDLQKTVREAGEHLFFASQGLKGRETIISKELGACPYAADGWDFENDYVAVKEIAVQKTGQ